ncbi:MAG TPA: hypothetical protein ENK91_05790, partial [Bacteroidetes bacterium]|nr:hypothetical protein [Bacteroidota bacterium]
MLYWQHPDFKLFTMKKHLLYIFIIFLPFFIQGQTELCTNGIDDDGDGLIDLFDPDCPCSDSTYQAYCPVNCENVPDSFPDFKMKKKWETDFYRSRPNSLSDNTSIVAGDIDNDGIVEILCYSLDSGGVVIYNGSDGSIKTQFNLKYSVETTFLAIADVDGDGSAEIFVPINREFDFTGILCYDINGNLLWESEDLLQYFGVTRTRMYIANIADFNGDGIPEIYFGAVILNSLTGKVLCHGTEGRGAVPYIKSGVYTWNHVTVAGDLLPDNPGLELAAGNTVYKVNITNINDSTGNSMIPLLADTVVKDGFTAIADIDGDGELDIIVNRGIGAYKTLPNGIWVWNPRTQKLIARDSAGDSGSLLFIGDVDGDCSPEIGMTYSWELRMYKYTGTDTLQLLYSMPTTDASGLTGITMFDFNQDGRQELVYRDQDTLRIIDGPTGKTISSTKVLSGTLLEYPIVVDIDNDNQAEILVNGFDGTIGYPEKIYAFESAGAPWAPARSVWNQTAYNVTNINDDLTVPRYPQNPATFIQGTDSCSQPTCPQVYNSFMAQA